MELKTILEAYRNGERGLPTYDELVEIDAALRAQADAKPAGHFFKASRLHPWIQVEADCPNGVPLYTHPAPEAAQALSDESILAVAAALESARVFIRNGVALGYIRMPDADCPDPAHGTLPLIERAMTILTRTSAATVAEPSECQQQLIAAGKTYPKSCRTCGLGPCRLTSSGLPSVEHNAPPMPTVKPARIPDDQHDREMEQVIRQRDAAEEAGTNLAERVGEFLGIDVGEWSSANDPIQCAIEALEEAEFTRNKAAQQQAEPVGDERSARQLERAAAIVRWVIHVLGLIAKADSMQHGRLNLSYERDSFSRALAKLHEAETIIAAQSGQRAGVALLAAEHTGMRVDYQGLFKQARAGLRREPSLAEMLRQLQDHMTELGRRWYAGDIAVVDELLQLYCVEREARTALAAAPTPAAQGGDSHE